MSVNIALVRLVYPPARLGRGVGLNALVVGVGFAVGPTVASLVLAVAPWPWLFAINVPIGVVALACALPNLPRTPPHGHRFDAPTAFLAAGTFAALFFALGNAAQQALWPRVVPPLALALVLGAMLLRRQRGHAAPMLPVDLLRRPMFALSATTAVAAFMTQGLAFVGLPFWFETVLHRDPVQTGFLLAPWPIVTALAAPVAGRLSGPPSGRHPRRHRPRAARARHAVAAADAARRRRRRHLRADGALRRRLRLFPVAQPQGADVERAARAQRRRERDDRDRAPHRADRRAPRSSRSASASPAAPARSWALGLGAAAAALAALSSFARTWAR